MPKSVCSESSLILLTGFQRLLKKWFSYSKSFKIFLVVAMNQYSFLLPCCHCQLIQSTINHTSIRLHIHPSILPFIHSTVHSFNKFFFFFIQQIFIKHLVWARYSARWWPRDIVVSVDICPLGGYSLVRNIDKEIDNYSTASGPVQSSLGAQKGGCWPEGVRESAPRKCCLSRDPKDKKKEEGQWDIFRKKENKCNCYPTGQRSSSCWTLSLLSYDGFSCRKNMDLETDFSVLGQFV